ncbi:MAG TPA: hypothetical protein VGM81_12955 [Burkholderiaceae bacterium]|jgi:hypothetical protein
MDLGTILSIAGGALLGALLAVGFAAWWWGGQLKEAAQRLAALDESRRLAREESGKLRRQVDQMQQEVNDWRIQAMRAKSVSSALEPASSREEIEDMLLRATPPAAPEPFAATVILPRRPQQAEGEAPFPATDILPRRP